ncbi:hypothetical protein ABZT06_46230 [Streptomyces sp. NPDC005483]|uniref:hypothetical protein n=1 Tax=Streptomyces sp. NPDC005483 TaxID=3154882 RepID=UPI0033AF7452
MGHSLWRTSFANLPAESTRVKLRTAEPPVQNDHHARTTASAGSHRGRHRPVPRRRAQLTLPPGQSTGRHHHDGSRHGLVQQATLSHLDSGCASDGVHATGSTVTEPSGAGHVHIGRNLSTTDVVLDVPYVLPQAHTRSEGPSAKG